MPEAITITTVLVFLFWSCIFGLGFAIGGWLWSVIVAALSRGKAP
jgi:hypothetical protein